MSDLGRSIAFYRDVVGLPLALEVPELGAAFFWIGGRGEAMLGLWSLGSTPLGLSLHVALRASLEDVLGACDALRSVKNMAVEPTRRGHGVGRTLVQAAIGRAREQGRATLAVAAAAADVDNLRFYQRVGFRLRSVERDAFSPETGYAAGTLSHGIRLRDRVWLDLDLQEEPR